MDLVRKIRLFYAIAILCIMFTGCEKGRHDSEPPEFEYVVVKFRNEGNAKYVIVEKDNERYHQIVNYWTTVEHEDYTDLYEILHKGYYTGKNCLIPLNCVMTGIQWGDFSTKEHGYWFSKEEIIEEHPFLAYYRIPEHVIGVYVIDVWPTGEAVNQLNAMIDNGTIEQYRVDLGY